MYPEDATPVEEYFAHSSVAEKKQFSHIESALIIYPRDRTASMMRGSISTASIVCDPLLEFFIIAKLFFVNYGIYRKPYRAFPYEEVLIVVLSHINLN